jgi:DNA-binding GntR family transcriptional regulator
MPLTTTSSMTTDTTRRGAVSNNRTPQLLGIQKISRGPLREQVRIQIKNLILANKLRPGQPVVIDRLAHELGVSHTPVREALAMLGHDGWVTMRPYENPRVAMIDTRYVQEAWDMRVLLEGWGINRATANLADEALEEMERELQEARREAEQSRFELHMQSDMDLHGMVLRAAGNKLYERLAQLVSDQSIRARSLVEAIASAEEVLGIIDEHDALVAALQSRDPELAHQRLIEHLEAGRERTLVALETMQESSN